MGQLVAIHCPSGILCDLLQDIHTYVPIVFSEHVLGSDSRSHVPSVEILSPIMHSPGQILSSIKKASLLDVKKAIDNLDLKNLHDQIKFMQTR